MTWTAHTYSAGEVLASSKMTTLQDNFEALVEGHSGAPAITSSAIGLGVIRRSSLNTTTASGSVAVSGSTSYTLAGGTYSWWTAGAQASGPGEGGGITFGNNNTAVGVIGLHTGSEGPLSFYVDECYVQASPPYNLGNGDIPLFVFAALDRAGRILDLQVMPDPPWAYHGPTDIRAHRYDRVSGRAFRTDNGVERELTAEFKNSDMRLIPHPFFARARVVLLDPLSHLTDRLHTMLVESHASEVRRLIDAAVTFDNESAGFNTPPGVLGVRGRIR